MFFKGLTSSFFIISTLSFSVPAGAQSSDFPAGSGSVKDFSKMAFSRPLSGVSQTERREFFVGNAFFRDAWVTAPSATVARDGLGPTFNAVSCSSCHQMDGRGIGYRKDRVDISLLFRLSHVTAERTLVPDPVYGDQINPFGIQGVSGEGTVGVRFQIIHGVYPDGTAYELRNPIFDFSALNFGALSPATRTSARVAPQVIGLGLIENIKVEDILALEDATDANGDGISGRANWVPDLVAGTLAVGRFGWKASEPTLEQQNAAAFKGDLGLTSRYFPEESCPAPQVACAKAPNGGTPEVENLILDRVTTYLKLVAVPERRKKADPQIQAGEVLFEKARCQACHTPSFTTGNASSHQILNQQLIWPYSDFLLHDMGMELADHRPDGRANGREWRTQPLWGIGLIPLVNGHSNLLHDGRARNVEEAILWHGGEASASRDLFKNMNLNDRLLLIQFVENL